MNPDDSAILAEFIIEVMEEFGQRKDNNEQEGVSREEEEMGK